MLSVPIDGTVTWTDTTLKRPPCSGLTNESEIHFPFYEIIHPAMNTVLRGIVSMNGQFLIVGSGTEAEILEFGKQTRIGIAWE